MKMYCWQSLKCKISIFSQISAGRREGRRKGRRKEGGGKGGGRGEVEEGRGEGGAEEGVRWKRGLEVLNCQVDFNHFKA